MFEEYLCDTRALRDLAVAAEDIDDQRRYYRCATFCAVSAVESFVNYHAEAFRLAGVLPSEEVAFLCDEAFKVEGTKLVARSEFHRLEDKLRLLIGRFAKDFDFNTNPSWSRFLELKGVRDALVHSREDSDETEPARYEAVLATGVPAAFDLVNALCLGIVDKPLRTSVMELA